ncbi:MAG: hypothetical protein ABIG87_03110 [Patescibacteria group bacterium]
MRTGLLRHSVPLTLHFFPRKDGRDGFWRSQNPSLREATSMSDEVV